MLVGVPKEIKVEEYRVGLTPTSVRELVHHGHEVIVQTQTGAGIGIGDDAYQAAGARIADTAEEIFATAELLVKVKEPQPHERQLLREGQVLFTYLHLAPDPEQTRDLVNSGCTAIAYETVTDPHGGLPLLAPMSEVAGRMAAQVAARCLEKHFGGAGVLLGGVPGVEAAHVVVLGGGMAGTNAARIAMGMEARVTVIEKSLRRLYELDLQFGPALNTIYSTRDAIERYVTAADVVIGTVLAPGAPTPKLISREMVQRMRPGAVIVDVSIDQGGCSETSRPTTHLDPTYLEEGVVHYGVTNMPGAVPRTSACALNNATLPFTLALADQGCRAAMAADPHLRNGLNVHRGRVTYEAVARSLGYTFQPAAEALGI